MKEYNETINQLIEELNKIDEQLVNQHQIKYFLDLLNNNDYLNASMLLNDIFYYEVINKDIAKLLFEYFNYDLLLLKKYNC